MMSNPRIAPLEPPYPAGVQENLDKVMRGASPLLLFRTVAHNPRVLQRMMAGGLLDHGSISIRARELMILRICARCGAEYEWGVHVASFAAKVQWSSEQIHATVHGDYADECWTAEDKLVIQLADQLYETSRVDDSLWIKLSAHFKSEQLIELIMLAGLYHAVSFITNSCDIQLEAFAPRFPAAQ
jgi:alkylhydroperoxidase family enzyme